MQLEIKKAALEVPRTAIINNRVVEQFPLSNLPKQRVQLKLHEKIFINSNAENFFREVKKANTFVNPKYKSNEQQGYSNWQTSMTIETYQCHDDGSISLPRGFLPNLLKIFEKLGITPEIEDLRAMQPVEFPALEGITMRPYQVRAVNQAMQSDQGVIVSPTGSGKSLIGLELIHCRGQKALILVHRSELASQWIALIKERFGIKAGFIGDGVIDIRNEITVGMVQTIALYENEIKFLSNSFGLILLYEVHHAPATTFFEVLDLFTAKYRYGLSATPSRRDGLEPMIYLAIGPVISTISKKEVEGIGATVPATVIAVKTNFNPGLVNSWHEFLGSLSSNADRNIKIISLAQQSQGSVLILVDRISHADQLSEMLERRKIDHVIAHGKINKKDRENVMDRIKLAKITVGTTSLLDEGLDVSVWGV